MSLRRHESFGKGGSCLRKQNPLACLQYLMCDPAQCEKSWGLLVFIDLFPLDKPLAQAVLTSPRPWLEVFPSAFAYPSSPDWNGLFLS